MCSVSQMLLTKYWPDLEDSFRKPQRLIAFWSKPIDLFDIVVSLAKLSLYLPKIVLDIFDGCPKSFKTGWGWNIRFISSLITVEIDLRLC